jgi:hypothetical protein
MPFCAYKGTTTVFGQFFEGQLSWGTFLIKWEIAKKNL